MSKISKEKSESKTSKFLLYLSNLFIIGGILYLFILFFPVIKLELQYQLNKWKKVEYKVVDLQESSSAASFNLPEPIYITPSSTDFGIIIEKINVNATVQADVDVMDEPGYWKALEKTGVAHAKGTKYPGQYGNSYLFAHSTVNPLEINTYNAVFTLLHKIEPGDRIVTFFQGTRYDYYVESKEIVDPTNVTPLTRNFDEPVLTLQTCYPPGTDLKRLIVTAKMKKPNQ